MPPPKDADIEIAINVQPEDLTAMYDPMQIELAMKNLLDNAYQAMDGGGVLSIEAYKQNDEVVIQISDTGAGIPEKNIDKIFQPLFSTKIRGFGLGLAVTKQYIEVNKGRIEFESENGKGTTFSIYLPV